MTTPLTPQQMNTEMEKYLEGRERFVNKLTDTERSLSEQLMLISTVLISINAIVLGAMSSVKHLAVADKYFILAGFILLSLSIFAGIIHYFYTIQFYKNWALAINKIIIKLANSEYDSQEAMRNSVFEIQDGQRQYSNQVFMYIQIGLLAVALLIYLFLIVGVLF